MSHPERASLSLFDGVVASGMSVNEVWLGQISVGGVAAEIEVEAYLLGLLQPSPHQHDVLAQAINEHFIALGQDHPVAYSDTRADEDATDAAADADGAERQPGEDRHR